MLLGGLWHGASWNFVFWGGFHGAILIIYRALDLAPEREPPPVTPLGHLRRAGFFLLMFVLTNVGWVLFRASSLAQIGWFFTHAGVAMSAETASFAASLAFAALPILVVQAAQHLSGDLLVIARLPLPARVAACGAMLVGLLLFGVRTTSEFIYFQF
jgi:D-alanyl-lipoteichoic acid acyltransferase DltB (MBOAT superfamily)